MVPLFLTFFCGLRGGGALGESVTCPQKGAEANCSAGPDRGDLAKVPLTVLSFCWIKVSISGRTVVSIERE